MHESVTIYVANCLCVHINNENFDLDLHKNDCIHHPLMWSLNNFLLVSWTNSTTLQPNSLIDMYTQSASKSKCVSSLSLFVSISMQKLCSFLSAPTRAMIFGKLFSTWHCCLKNPPTVPAYQMHIIHVFPTEIKINWVTITYMIIGAYIKTHLWMIKILVIPASGFEIRIWHCHAWCIKICCLQIMKVPLSTNHFLIVCASKLLQIMLGNQMMLFCEWWKHPKI